MKTTAQGGPKGYGAGKKVKGRKRHVMTDTLGLLLALTISVASVQDRDGAMDIMDQARANAPGIEAVRNDADSACARERSATSTT